MVLCKKTLHHVREHSRMDREHSRMAHKGFSLKYVNGNKRKQLTEQLLIHTYVSSS